MAFRERFQYAMAVAGTNVGVAWLDPVDPIRAPAGPGPVPAPRGLRFAILGSDLAPAQQSGCLAFDTGAFALAATPVGWIVAVEIEGHIDLYSLDRCGAPRGVPRRIEGSIVFMASRSTRGGTPLGGPLLVWRSGSGSALSSALLDGTANVEASSTLDPRVAGLGQAVFDADGFVVMGSTGGVSDTSFLGRIGLDGTLRSFEPLPKDVAALSLANLGTDLYFSYGLRGQNAPPSYWTRLDSNGRLLGNPTAIEGDPTGYYTLVAFGTWLGAVGGDQRVEVIPLLGTTAQSRFSVALFGSYAHALSGGAEPIVAWDSADGFVGLARLRE